MVSDCRMHIVSDSLGDTAAAVVAAAASQFPELRDAPIGRLSHLRDPAQVDAYLEAALSFGHGIVVFHTITDPGLRAALVRGARSRGIREVDLLGPSIEALSGMLGVEPIDVPGVLHEIDRGYFARIEAMEFAVSHDDGRNEHDLAAADIVLIGVSRTSKTPLSLLLASRGYKVANIPLALGVAPPRELFEVERARVFGLVSTVSVLAEVRRRRIGDEAGKVATAYVDPEKIQEDLDEARALMRRLGCIVVRTDGRAIEETAQVILRYYHAWTALRRSVSD
ncbi:MAG: kinase/pyrophosphorylase [Coriobacteriales bacterium]|jgi:regulator of PEP synthase PpsR (kinase-PPPase family)|nr:kinase/pyrophosphorylase [Coriobacteriales bacterium]